MLWLTLKHYYTREPVYANMELAQQFHREAKQTTPYTIITFDNDSCLCVEETPQQILEMLPPRV